MRRMRPTTIIAMIALLVGSAILLWYRDNTVQLIKGLTQNQVVAERVQFPDAKPSAKPKVRHEGVPVKLEIPSLSITLPIEPGYFNERANTWTLSLDKAHHAVSTPNVNTIEGNTFIYGHNRKGVFMTLAAIKPGAELIISTNNDMRFTYIYESTQTVKPSDGSVFTYQGPPIVTIQTCSGSFYQNRQLFFFSLQTMTHQHGHETHVEHL